MTVKLTNSATSYTKQPQKHSWLININIWWNQNVHDKKIVIYVLGYSENLLNNLTNNSNSEHKQ